jgi:Astacin (Peptidase family M12A)
VLLAVNAWNTTSVVKLVPFVATNTDFFFITRSADAAACSSPIGKQGGQQPVACSAAAAAGVIMHEIGHALGMIHEHKRPDRNTFITLNNSNIAPGRIGQFSPVDLTNCPIGPYDCGSIMHYGATSFSVDGLKQTITIKDPAICGNIGQRNLLSAGDLAAARTMYDSISTLSNKITLSDTSDFGPVLAFHDNALFLAWRGSGNDNLNVSVSDDRGVSFHGKHASPESSDDAPTLASHAGRLFIAFKGSGNDNINVAVVRRSATGARDIQSLSEKVTLGDTSDASPAIASHNGSLYVAFKGSGNDNLNVAVSTDSGVSFGGKYTSGETSSDSPALVSCGGSLYISWKGSGNENFNVATVDVGTDAANPSITGFSNKVTFGDTTGLRPALVRQGGLLFCSWRGAGNDNLNVIFPGDHDGCTQKFTTPESSSHAPSLAADDETMWMAWKGSGNEDLNVAVVEFESQSDDAAAQELTAMNNDIFNELVQIQATLAASLQNLSEGINAGLEQQHFTNLALAEEIAQGTTMICQLDQISKQTCDLLSEAHFQTGAQREIAKGVERLLGIVQVANPAAELELQRHEKLQQEIEKCCPPDDPPPLCEHTPCPQPPQFRERPPSVDYRPIPEPTPLRDIEG